MYQIIDGKKIGIGRDCEAWFKETFKEVDPEVELVSVCTDHASHAEIVRDVLNAGKHVVCEKSAARVIPDRPTPRRRLRSGSSTAKGTGTCRTRWTGRW